MRRWFSILVFLTLLSALDPTLASVTTGTMRVIVEDAEGGPLRGALVTAESVESLARRTASTDESGEAVLLGLDPSAKYIVATQFTGYDAARNENVLVRTGETTTLQVVLKPGLIETVHVVEQSPLVDVTTAMISQDITLDLTDSLPTGCTYTSYLQLVPGVAAASLGSGWGDNPASRSGLNYTEYGAGPGNGWSSDNAYYIEGINVTGIYGGTAGIGFNTEAIQEQNVITGGIPAEYKGAPGLISNVVTKSGGNQFSGSVNYYFQNNHLLATDEKSGFIPDDFSAYDTAFTFGGPIRRDKAWFFLSYGKVYREDYVLNAAPGGFSRTVKSDGDQVYAKATWQLTNKDRLSGTYLADPRLNSGSRNSNVVNERLRTQDQDSPRYIVNYQRVFGSGVLELGFGKHVEDAQFTPVLDDVRNDILFDQGQTFTVADEQLGGHGTYYGWEDTNEFFEGSAEWLIQSSWGQHTVKAGFNYEDHEIREGGRYSGDGIYQSLSTDLASFLGMPVTAGYLDPGVVTAWPDFDVYSSREFNGLIATIDGLPNRDSFYTLLDTDTCGGDPFTCTVGADGVISMAEAAANIVFDSTAGNPHGAVNFARTINPSLYSTQYGSEGLSVYLQDTLQRGKWTINAGLRAEKWEHFAEDGSKIFTFDWEIAPRVSVVRDLRGDGKQKLSVFYGRYYDPAKNDLTQWAGDLLGPELLDQIYVNGEWVTYSQSGGTLTPSAIFAPNTATPYTDEWQIGYEIDLGHNMSLAANVIKRETRDLVDDYWIGDYALEDPADPTSTTYPGCPFTGDYAADSAACLASFAHPNSLFLGLDYFGLSEFPDSPYVIATLAGGFRDWEGVEIIFRKRLSNRWQAIASYAYGDAHGNSVADSSLSLQSDWIFLDPRAPNATGTLPGTERHRLKLLGSYHFDNGFKLGATYRLNSGFIENLLIGGGAPSLTGYPWSAPDFEYAGITGTWIEPGAVGGVVGPWWDVLDIRAQYNHQFGKVATEFFVDVFSVFNSQSEARAFPGVRDDPAAGWYVGGAWGYTPPRRFYLGARASF